MADKAAMLKATWETLAHKVLASVLVDNGAVFPVMDALGASLHWFPPAQAAVWGGVLQCVRDGTPPSVEAVVLRCAAKPGYVQAIANQWTDEDNRRVVYNAQEMRRLGALHQAREIGRELQGCDEPGDILAAIEYAENRLTGLVIETNAADTSGRAADEEAWRRVEGFDESRIMPTGLAWFDKLAGGLWHGMNYWIVAPYKAGKSTLMRNVVLAVLGAGYGADVFCAEGSRYLFALDCQAMLAARLLLGRGENPVSLRLSGLFIYRQWKANVMSAQEYEAVQEAREVWRGYNVRIYDATDGIKALPVLRHTVRRDRMNHGVDACFADYSQLFGETGTIYERQSATAGTVQDIAAKEDVAFVMLAQKNEAAIGSPGAYSSGVKGGGDANAAADFEFIPMIDQQAPRYMNVTLKYSRHTATGGSRHTIDPPSGLIIDRWMARDEPPPDWSAGVYGR